ncbi:MAG: adenylosuccinate lyase family protein [Thermodesulfobacteriota bacterium]
MTASCLPRAHIVDSFLFGNGYASPEARRIFCDRRRLQRWLEVEVALAASQAELGIIPQAAAEALAASADLGRFDLGAIRADLATSSHSLIPLLRAWQALTPGEAGEWLHFGATTQDIQDTAQSLELRELCDLVDRDLVQIGRLLAALAAEHRATLMVGRTHGQQALPYTFGLKAAGWLDELTRNRERLAACRQRLLVAQLFAGVGTMASLGPQAEELLARFAGRLGLAVPATSWHAARDRSAELTAVLALVTGGLARIANEICQLARDEIGELAEPFHFGKIGSSTMPHKRNPETCEQIVVLARLVKSAAGVGFDTLVGEHERDYRAVRLEWAALAAAGLYASACTALSRQVLAGLTVDRERMAANARAAAERINSEALMFRLGTVLGKQTAHRLIYQAAMAAHDRGCSLAEALAQLPEVAGRFRREELGGDLRPEAALGQAAFLVDRLVAEAGRQLATLAQAPDRPCPLAGADGCCRLSDAQVF